MQQITWTTVCKKLSELKPLEKNPFGKITDAKRDELKSKIERLGVFEIATVNTSFDLLTFNKRYYILLSIHGADYEMDVRYPSRELTEQEQKEIVVASNIHEGEWDLDILKLDYSDFDIPGIDFDVEIAPAIDLDQLKKKPETRELKPFEQTHILISFPPERLIDLQELLEKIKQFEFVEYDQSSN